MCTYIGTVYTAKLVYKNNMGTVRKSYVRARTQRAHIQFGKGEEKNEDIWYYYTVVLRASHLVGRGENQAKLSYTSVYGWCTQYGTVCLLVECTGYCV